MIDEIFPKRSASALAYAVLRSGMKSADKAFFETGVYRFYMDLLDGLNLMKIYPSVRRFCESHPNWKIPKYPMQVKEAANGK